jgi:hypothetical protein
MKEVRNSAIGWQRLMIEYNFDRIDIAIINCISDYGYKEVSWKKRCIEKIYLDNGTNF